MLGWIVPLLIVALLAGFLSLGGVAGVSTQAGKLVVSAAIVVFVISMVISAVRRPRLTAR
jgi:uncharacterized membrane protein YtjA (UPF0391 family)